LRYLLVCVYFNFLMIIFPQASLFAFDSEYFDKYSREPVSIFKADDSSNSLDISEVEKQSLSDTDREHLYKLEKKISSLCERDTISSKDIFFVAKLIKHARVNPVFSQRRSIFIYPLISNYKNYSLQIYNTGKAFIHLKKNDPQYTKGGYKSFSRSIEFDTLKLYAVLTFPLDSESHLEKAKNELMVMDVVNRISKYNLPYLNYDITYGKKDGIYINKLSFITELYDKDLKKFSKEQKLSFKQTLSLVKKMLLAVQELHSYGVVHNDIKAQNFLVRKGLKYLVLTDYGLSQHRGNVNFGNGISGTRGYIDINYCLSRVRSGYSYRSFPEGVSGDVFSLGMSIYKEFFQNLSLASLVKDINHLAMPKKNTTRASVGFIESRVREYRLAHITLTEKLKNKEQGELKEFYKLILMMIHPKNSMRPSLHKCIEKISDIRNRISSTKLN
jgi:hypothetical protein